MRDKPVVKVTIPEDAEPLKRLWDNYVVIGEAQKSDRIKIVVGAGIRDGVRYINVREFYFKQKDGVWKAGRDGITIPLRIPTNNGETVITPYIQLMELFQKAAEDLEVMELEDPNNAVYVPTKRKGDK